MSNWPTRSSIRPAPSGELRADQIIAACNATSTQAVPPVTFAVGKRSLCAPGWKKKASSSSAPNTPASRPWATRSRQEAAQRRPGLERAIKRPEAAVQIAQGIGYPVMIKATPVAGARASRVAFDDTRPSTASTPARRSARRLRRRPVYIEKFVEGPRASDPGAGRSARPCRLPAPSFSAASSARAKGSTKRLPPSSARPHAPRSARRPWRWPRR